MSARGTVAQRDSHGAPSAGGTRRYAVETYRTGRITPISMMLRATSTEDFLGRAKALDKISRNDLAKLDDLATPKPVQRKPNLASMQRSQRKR